MKQEVKYHLLDLEIPLIFRKGSYRGSPVMFSVSFSAMLVLTYLSSRL